MVPPTRVVSTVIWFISWGDTVEGCTHPWRVSIVPHGPRWVWISLHRLLILPWKVFCNPSLTYMHHGFSPLSTHCIALPLPFGQYSNSDQVLVEN